MLRADLLLDLPGFALHARFTAPSQGVTALFGPSGAGKTRLLRALAGLEPRARGSVQFADTPWQDDARRLYVPAHRRALGFVFQEPSLLDHLSVRGNLEFGFRRTPAARRTVDWDRTIALLDVGPLLGRSVGALSGGERQRVAIARALLASPRLLLLDEPLAALDQARKRELLATLARLQRELHIPMVYVSHHIEEIAALADHLILLRGGVVLASGPLAQTLARTDLPTAEDDDLGVVIDTRVAGHDAPFHLALLRFAGGELHVASPPLAAGAAVRVRIPARDVSVALSAHADSSILNRIAATVVDIQALPNPANVLVRLDAGGVALLARITRRSVEQLPLAPGRRVWAQVKSAALIDTLADAPPPGPPA